MGAAIMFCEQDFGGFLARFPATVDLIVTSPPYVDARTADAYGVTNAWTSDDACALGDSMFAALRPGGTALIVVGSPVRHWRGTKFPTERGLQPARWLLDLADRVGFAVRDVLVYGRMGLPGAYAGRFRNDWEPMIWLEKPCGVATFNKPALDEPAKCPRAEGTPTGGRRADGSLTSRGRTGDAVARGIKRRGTVWDYGNIGKGHTGSPVLEAQNHPASFTLHFAEDAVACFSSVGDLVVDPFCGRGTVAVACKRLGRKFAGGDLGKRPSDGQPWADIARAVYESETP